MPTGAPACLNRAASTNFDTSLLSFTLFDRLDSARGDDDELATCAPLAAAAGDIVGGGDAANGDDVIIVGALDDDVSAMTAPLDARLAANVAGAE